MSDTPVTPRGPARTEAAALVPADVSARWLAHHGDVAERFLDDLGAITRRWTRAWRVRVVAPMTDGSVSVVLAVTSPHCGAVMKLATPWSAGPGGEAQALRTWSGSGAVQLLRASDDGRALLLERVHPGDSAEGLSTREFAALVERLRVRHVPQGLPGAAEPLNIRFGRARENRHRLLDESQLRRVRMLALETAGAQDRALTLLHGDLLSKNILRSDRAGVLAIDPNPFIGDREFDLALWALTERPVADAPARAESLWRLLKMSESRILAWMAALAAPEICLASLPRALATLELARALGASWL